MHDSVREIVLYITEKAIPRLDGSNQSIEFETTRLLQQTLHRFRMTLPPSLISGPVLSVNQGSSY